MIGTPLIQALDLDAKVNSNSTNQQRYKSQKQQIVTDAQGRRRLHGAFTGGFSAGYHNTVDSVSGFVPKTFVSRRGEKRGSSHGPSTSFSHKPEDYMDEEDQTEFGIAPKKIRVIGNYNNERDKLQSSVIVNCKSFGERILKNIYLATNHKRSKRKSGDYHNLIYPEKNNYHGIGYQTLKSREKPSDIRRGHDPLEAFFSDGKKLKISGQAFGMGVLNDDDGYDDDLSIEDLYGHDDMNNYEFPTTKSRLSKNLKTDVGDSSGLNDPFCIPNFILSEVVTLNDEISHKPPKIPQGWKAPRREIKPVVNLEKQRSFLDNKFVTSSTTELSSISRYDIESRSGLFQLSELKLKHSESSTSVEEKIPEASITKPESPVVRKIVEWRPCSLLCKRFNVPNPFPDNLFCGVKPGALQEADDGPTTATKPQVVSGNHMEMKAFVAPMKLRSSIYDQALSDVETLSSDEGDDDHGGHLDESETVFPDFHNNDYVENQSSNQDKSNLDHEDEECMVVSVQRKKPELIVLDSSSSSSTSP